MPLITWNETFSVHVREMDQQHQMLIQIINQLHDAMSQGKAQHELGNILEKMLAYARMHFAEEEKLMAEWHFPGLDQQKAEHAAFLRKAQELNQALLTGKLALSIPLSAFLKEWWTGHILHEDKQYGIFMNS